MEPCMFRTAVHVPHNLCTTFTMNTKTNPFAFKENTLLQAGGAHGMHSIPHPWDHSRGLEEYEMREEQNEERDEKQRF